MQPIGKSLSSITVNNRDNATIQIDQLTKGMSSRDRAYVLKEVSHLPLAEKISLIENLRLLTEGLYIQNKVEIIRKLFDIPLIERQALLEQALRLITHTMILNDRILIVKELWDLPYKKREEYVGQVLSLSMDLSDRDKIEIITILSQVTASDKNSFIEHYFTVVSKSDIETGHRIQILTLLKEKNQSDREELIKWYFSLLSPQMNSKDKISLLEFLAQDIFSNIPKKARKDLILQGLLLITEDMDVQDRMNIIVALRKKFLRCGPFLVEQTLRLVTRDMNAIDRVLILTRLGSIKSSAECESLVKQTLLLNGNADIENRLSTLLYLISKTLSRGRQTFLAQTLPLINGVPNAEDRLRILHFLNSRIPPEAIPSFVIEALPIITNNPGFEDRLGLLIVLNIGRTTYDGEWTSYNTHHSAVLSFARGIPAKFRDFAERVRECIETELFEIFNRSQIKGIFVTHNDKVIKYPLKVVVNLYEHLKRYPLKLLPLIHYSDSLVVDAGGVTRSIVAILMEALCDPKYSLITGPVFNVVPIMGTANDTSSLSLEDQEKCFTIMGRFFSAAVQGYQSIVIGQYFDPIVFEMLFHLTAKEAASKDSSEVFDKMLKIYILKKLNAIEEIAENLVQNNITEELREVYCIKSKDQFIKENELDKKFKAILIIAKSLYDSLFLKTRWAGTSAEALQEKIQGVISGDIVQNAFTLEVRNNAGQTSMEYLKKWVAGTHLQLLQRFVEAISGMKTLTPSTKLTIKGIEGIDKLPVFHTCIFRIDVSRYSSYKTFKEKLELSLEYCFSRNGFQMP